MVDGINNVSSQQNQATNNQAVNQGNKFAEAMESWLFNEMMQTVNQLQQTMQDDPSSDD